MTGFIGKAYHLFTSGSYKSSNIWLFCLPLFFLMLADGAMAYIFPILVEENLNSNTLMGVIMALSSVAGLVSDFTFPQLLKDRSWKFQLIAAILLAVLFPISLSIGIVTSSIYLFILGSAVWGVYWEFMAFSQQSYVISEDKSGEYSKDWGILYLIHQITAVIGPILGSMLLMQSLVNTNITIITFLVFSLIFSLIISKKSTRNEISAQKIGIKQTFNIIKEARYWRLLSVNIWPVMIISITSTIINAFFWTIGGLFGTELFGEHGVDWIVLVLFSGPTIFGALILTRVSIKNKKKKFSQIFLTIGSAFLAMLFLAEGSKFLILLLITLGSFSLAFIGPLNEAVYSDLLERLKKDRLHLLGIAKANVSIAFIIGPLLAGFLADRLDYLVTFSIVGVFGVIVGLILLLVTPKKIRISQSKIRELP